MRAYPPNRRPGGDLGFTLVELLVVIAIIALLIGLLLPSISGAKAIAVRMKCMSNARMHALAMASYGTDNDARSLTWIVQPQWAYTGQYKLHGDGDTYLGPLAYYGYAADGYYEDTATDLDTGEFIFGEAMRCPTDPITEAEKMFAFTTLLVGYSPSYDYYTENPDEPTNDLSGAGYLGDDSYFPTYLSLSTAEWSGIRSASGQIAFCDTLFFGEGDLSKPEGDIYHPEGGAWNGWVASFVDVHAELITDTDRSFQTEIFPFDDFVDWPVNNNSIHEAGITGLEQRAVANGL